MQILWQDLRYGLRVLRTRPAFTIIAALALALGIGANTAIFSVVNTVLLKPLAYQDPDRLVLVWEHVPQYGFPHNTPAPANFLDWRAQNSVFSGMAAMAGTSFNLTGGGDPLRITGHNVSAEIFPLLGVAPLHGRTFTPEEDKPGNRVVVLSHGFWQRRFGGNPGIIGQTITLDGNNWTVLGVMPAGFRLLDRTDEFWGPIAFTPQDANRRGSHYLQVIARLKDGVRIEQAQAEMSTIASRLEAQYPRSNSGVGAAVSSIREEFVGDLQTGLWVLFAAVGFVLLIACANVANLLLARAAARSREIAIRSALGANRLRIIRQMLTESILLSTFGGALGLLFAIWGVSLLAALAPNELAEVRAISLDRTVLFFTLPISLGTGLVFGLAPALQASRPDLNETLKDGGRSGADGGRRSTLRSALVITEVALAVVLLTGAGLMLRSFARLQSVDPGFRADHLLTMRTELSGEKYARNESRTNFYQQVLERVRAVPGVASAAMISFLPMTFNGGSNIVTVEGRPPVPPGQEQLGVVRTATPDYFQTMAIPLREGREFGEQDTAQSQLVAVINEMMARYLWPGENPIGKRFKFGRADSTSPWLTIVGVAGSVRQFELEREAKPEIYMPPTQMRERWLAPRDLAIRTTTDPEAVAAAVRRAIWSVDANQPIADLQTMEEIVARSIAAVRFNMILLGAFAGIALLLAAVGIYGVMSYLAAQRTKEIGIRVALGAQVTDIVKLVARQGAVLISIGLGIGLGASFALTKLMASLLYEISASDPVTFIVIPAVLGFVALAACLVPARRAARVDPLEALRSE
jgi:putative ABC transport system permease protein